MGKLGCYHLSDAELAEFLADGYIVRGIFSTADDCFVNCPTSSSSSSSPSVSQSASPVSMSVKSSISLLSICGCNNVPTTLFVTLAPSAINPCNCLAGAASIAIVWNPSLMQWEGSGPFGSCGFTINITFACTASESKTFTINWTIPGCQTGIGIQPDVVFSCEPFQWGPDTVTLGSSDTCCNGSTGFFDITVTS